MKCREKVKFPCGYEYEMNFKSSFFDFSSEANIDSAFDKCPLHGKECPPK